MKKYLERQFAVAHQAKRRHQQACEAQDNEHCSGHFWIYLAIGHAGYGKTDNNKRQIHECQIGNYSDNGRAIWLYTATGGKKERVNSANNADKQGAISDSAQVGNPSHKGMTCLKVQDAEDKEQAGGKRIGKYGGLKSRTYNNEYADNGTNKTSAFGFAVTQKK